MNSAAKGPGCLINGCVYLLVTCEYADAPVLQLFQRARADAQGHHAFAVLNGGKDAVHAPRLFTAIVHALAVAGHAARFHKAGLPPVAFINEELVCLAKVLIHGAARLGSHGYAYAPGNGRGAGCGLRCRGRCRMGCHMGYRMRRDLGRDVAQVPGAGAAGGLGAGLLAFTGFGSFKVTERAARKGRNPRTGKEILIPAAKAVKFSPGKALKDAVN